MLSHNANRLVVATLTVVTAKALHRTRTDNTGGV